MRTRHEVDFGDNSTNAGAYILMHAIEETGLPDSVDPVIEQGAAVFIHSGVSSRIIKPVKNRTRGG